MSVFRLRKEWLYAIGLRTDTVDEANVLLATRRINIVTAGEYLLVFGGCVGCGKEHTVRPLDRYKRLADHYCRDGISCEPGVILTEFTHCRLLGKELRVRNS